MASTLVWMRNCYHQINKVSCNTVLLFPKTSCFAACLSTKTKKLIYRENGDPMKVVQEATDEISTVNSEQVLVEMLAAPVNPADINTIQGKYPARPSLPAVPGNEGVAKVIAIGAAVKRLTIGDTVVPLEMCMGTWRQHAVFNESMLFKVPSSLGLVEAATLTVNPCTAYRMLRDFVDLKPGDTVIQNGANSACGQNVIQLCKAWNFKSVNVVRNRDNIDALKAFLRTLGADCVLTEEELRTTTLFKSVDGGGPAQFHPPKLALNCVGGKSALELLRHLTFGGTMATYGGMSREPVTVPTSALIFKDIKLYGYWMTHWSKTHAQSQERWNMFNELIDLFASKKLSAPAFKMIQFDQYKEALMNTMTVKGMTGLKYVLHFSGEN